MDAIDEAPRAGCLCPYQFTHALNESRLDRLGWTETGEVWLNTRASRLIQGTCPAASRKPCLFIYLRVVRVQGDI